MTIIELPDAPATQITTRPDRWQPTRAGLIGLWHYWDETFTFHNGRLLLRGPNGSGKSMALELLLPFVLDADTAPHRLTSAARARGSLYDRIMAGATETNRAGFAWVEFRRGDAVFTVGVRLRASTATRRVDTDFFTTSQAVGAGLTLLDERREPLSRKALIGALDGFGRVHDTREDHREAVRSVLFPGFGADRFDSVLTALLALRKEKLSQNLDLDKLSAVLTDALPAIDEHDLAVVAEGFERLDRRRSELAALKTEVDEIRVLARRQRAYARAVLASVSGRVRNTASRRDAVTREEREASEALEQTQAQRTVVLDEHSGLTTRSSQIDDELAGHLSSSAYRDGGQLADLRNQLAVHESNARHADDSAAANEVRLAQAREVHGEASEAATTTRSNLDTAAADLQSHAEALGADAIAEEAVAAEVGEEGRLLVSAWTTSRRQLIIEVREALTDHDEALRHRKAAEARVEDEQAEVDARLAAHAEAERLAMAAAETYAEAVDAWAASSTAVGADRLRMKLVDVDRRPTTVKAVVDELSAEVHTEHALARREIAERQQHLSEEHDTLISEREVVAAGGLVEPVPPAWRSERADTEGAALWLLVDPRDNAPVDGLEAALGASGLLDAWVRPDGSVDTADPRADLVLTATGGRPTSGPSLADHLAPHPNPAVPAEIVDRVLASIPVAPSVNAPVVAAGEPGILIGLDGTFRLGSAVGRGSRHPAILLGSAARERHRLERLADLDRAIADVNGRLASLAGEATALERAVAAVAADLAALPAGDELTAAEAGLENARNLWADASGRLAKARDALTVAEQAVRTALRTLTSAGARHHLPTTSDGLDEIEHALRRFDDAAGTWERRRSEQVKADQGLARAEQTVEDFAGAVADARRLADQAHQAAASLKNQIQALEASVGAEYAEVLAEIEELRAEKRSAQSRTAELIKLRSTLDQKVGSFEAKVEEAAGRRAAVEHERAMAHADFTAAVRAGLAADGDVDLPAEVEGLTAVLDAARATLAEVDEPDEAAVRRTSSGVDEALHQARSALGGRVDLYREMADEGWWILRAAAAGLRRRVAEQAEAMAAELEAGRNELAAEEEQLFEQVLAGTVRQALAERIRLANHLVDQINAQLGKVKTQAAGVTVRLRWDVDPEQLDAVKSARRLLLRDPADLTESETASLQAFVRARVEQARAELDTHAPWEARLRETLDYRAWHRFSLQISHRDWGGFKPATARLLQRLSTGERSMALHLPMLASISAHYTEPSGAPSGCPRLILLDELFAGVDTANRAQLFGTFTDWDLDAVLTSDHEWCQYATLDGIAIHQLHPPDLDQPVTSTRFWWDGSRRQIDTGLA